MKLRTFAACAILLTATAALGLRAGAQEPAAADPQLAAKATALLKTYCYRCHGVEFKTPGLDVLDRPTLLQPKDAKHEPFVVPGQPDNSALWQRLESDMPPEQQPQPTAAEKATIRRWLAAGAEFPAVVRPQRPFLGEDLVLTLIAQDLDTQPQRDRPNLRYFSLAHLWNDPSRSDDDLRLVRAAVSKLINSLSSEFEITPPREVDSDGVMLAINLHDYGWNEQKWQRLLSPKAKDPREPQALSYDGYPYGLKRGGEIASKVQVYERTHCDVPYVRADWFVRAASRPPLYHDLLGLARHARTVESDLNVNVARNFEQDQLWRAAFLESGVSRQNRMVERHKSKFGAYWKSYDFGSNLNRGDLFGHPLGPVVNGVENNAAFRHDGGEIIFHLANGLQAYLLVKHDDTRIDEGPINIVNDPQQFSGSPAIVNGISCMGCHKHGMINVTDTLRQRFADISGQPTAEKVLRLYPLKAEMDQLVDRDRERFLTALDTAIGCFLRNGPADQRAITDFPEPITQVARAYDRKLSVADVARELGLPHDPAVAKQLRVPTPDEFVIYLRVNSDLRLLSPLVAQEKLPREVWEKAYHSTSRKLKLGVPIVTLSN